MPIRLARYPADDPAYRCARGQNRPRAIAWFGFTSFWGHMRHLVASAIATENIDSRQWMIPDAPGDLLTRTVDVLGGRGAKPADTLLGAMGEELWIDFVSDTGDDSGVSEAVARLVVATYEAEEIDRPGHVLTLPRGDALILGGDLAYPVATVREITRRLVDPWNRVLEAESKDKPRVLFAIPGNHDWYDGLDGFARLCQAPCAFEGRTREREGDALHPVPDENPVLAWAEAFARGDHVHKPGSMALAGYVPVQRASYFRLALAPGLELFGVDRQLRGVDPRQQAYFKDTAFAAPRERVSARIVLMPDPARAWGERRPNGEATLASIGIVPAQSPSFVLAGDVHHFERSHEGPSVHVVAGGGGAFLQGARMARGELYAREAEFPGPRASWALLRSLPLHVAAGRAGWVVTSYFALFDAFAIAETYREGIKGSVAVAVALSLTVAIGTALLVGWRRHRMSVVVPFTVVLGLATGALPIALGVAADELFMRRLPVTNVSFALALRFLVAWLLATWASGFFFGVMLAAIARLGLNHAQPFAALGIPGFKHFLRMRVRVRNGASEVDTWVIGVVDPVGGSAPVLVDSFRFPRAKDPSG